MSSVSNLTELRALLSALPREELKTLNKEIREMIASAPKEKKEKKAKRPAAVGQKAWFAFMAQCRATLPERFTAGMKAPEMAVVCKAIRQEDEAVYTAFVEKFKADNTPEKSPDNSAPASDVSDSEGPCDSEVPSDEAPAEEAPADEAPISDAEAPVSATKPAKRVRLTPEQKAAKEATQSAEKEAKKAEKARAKEAKEAEEKAAKEAKEAKKAEKDALKAKEAEEKAAKKAARDAAKAAKDAAKAIKA